MNSLIVPFILSPKLSREILSQNESVSTGSHGFPYCYLQSHSVLTIDQIRTGREPSAGSFALNARWRSAMVLIIAVGARSLKSDNALAK